MSTIWDRLIECQEEIISIFDEKATEYDEPGLAHFNSDTWVNRVWRNEHVRRAHIDVVDATRVKRPVDDARMRFPCNTKRWSNIRL